MTRVQINALRKTGGTLTGTLTPSAGIVPASTGWVAYSTGGAPNLLNTTSGTSQTTTAGTIYWAEVPIWANCTLTGIVLTTGGTGGTDNWIAALYNSAGTLVANSALAGTVAPAANTRKNFPFVTPYAAVGPGRYFIAFQSNGTTARFLSIGTNIESFVCGSVAGVFGTLPTLVPGTTYTAGVAPFATTY